ncbi:MAG: hypothetical protein FWF96_05145, partial [Kiritimatiellaeota bacterium]|nr:hypothetical protein [Kiritimatiellota bacterium]
LAIEAMDPTRPTMVDGGRALHDQSMPVNGAHYDDYAGRQRRDIPDAFYDNSIVYTEAGKLHGNWIMAKNKPVFHGEAFFANGWRPAEFTMITGENAAIGRAHTFPARGLYMKMLCEGYRWDGVAAWHFSIEAADPAYWVSWQPVAALAREWDRTFAAGRPFPRTFKLYNQTQFATPITVRWAVHKPGEEPAAWAERGFTLPAGGRTDPWRVDIPAGNLEGDETAAGRGRRVLTVRCVRDGNEIFREDKDIWIINPDAAAKPDLGEETLYVWDAHGAAKKRLHARGIPYQEVAGLDEVPQGGLLLVGADTVPRELASSAAWTRFALAGGRALILDQEHPLRHQAIPVEAEPTNFKGRIAFIEDDSNPAFDGLVDDDFFCRSVDHIVYRNVWRKSLGMRSLAQCDEELGCSAYFEAPAGDGLLALCQFAVGAKLDAADPVMTRLFDNLVNRLAAYTPLRREVRSALGADSPAGRALARTGINAAQHASVDAALPAPGAAPGTLVIAPMSAVAQADAAKIKEFMDAGGWLVVNGLTPEHLDAFNALTGVENLIRPMAMERVKLAARRDWLGAGLSQNDLVMNTGKKMLNWMELFEPVSDQYLFVVDANDDIAAFAPGNLSPHDPEPGKGNVDHYSRNMVNGFTHEDTWMWIWQPNHARSDWAMTWDKPRPMATVDILPNPTYRRIKTIELRFDDDPAPMLLDIADSQTTQTFDLGGRVAKTLSFKPVEFHPTGNPNAGPTGIDTLAVNVVRDDDWRARVHPIDNIGGLARYAVGKGGVVLLNLNFMDDEVNPANRGKKDNILKTLLSNLGAVSAQGGRVTAGWGLTYKPVAIPQDKYNMFLTASQQPAWFGGAAGDLSNFTPGEGIYADVRFAVNDFRTSPAPAAMSLAGAGGRVQETEVAGIPVNTRADALFFLHTLNPGSPHLKEGTAVFNYRVKYDDETTLDIPVVWCRDVGPWQSPSPASYHNAAMAWAGPAPTGTNQRPVLYMMQWNNPHPEKTIAALDLLRAEDGKWGVPAVLAITAATKE